MLNLNFCFRCVAYPLNKTDGHLSSLGSSQQQTEDLGENIVKCFGGFFPPPVFQAVVVHC